MPSWLNKWVDFFQHCAKAYQLPLPHCRSLPQSREDRKTSESCLDDGGDPDEVLVSGFNVQLTRRQLACLKPGQWLNDEVINFYCKLLEEDCKQMENYADCWFPNSFFWQKLSGSECNNYCYKDVERWTTKAKIDIFRLDYVIFPMHIGGSHWALGAIDFQDKGFRYLDSLHPRPHQNFVLYLRRYLQDEYRAKTGDLLQGADAWDLITLDKPCPRQNNENDCGVFVCLFAECLSSGRDMLFDQDDIPDARIRLVAGLMRGNADRKKIY
jgi:Ulp1 family protease